jgi:hypothetical protein
MASPKQANVDVVCVPDSSKPEGVRFELSSNLGSSNELTFKNDNHPGFEVDFNLVDNDQTGCKFMHDPKDAMWVQKIEPGTPDPCPTSAMYWDQFEAKSVSKNDTQLSVRNLNDYVQLFAFSLRFTKPGWPDPILYDPIGSNQNGGGLAADSFAQNRLNMVLLVAGIAVIAFVAYRIWS